MVTTDLELRGMSCASCASRVERGLNRLEGVRATVNFAVERAHVQHGSAVSARDLVRVVESTGYRASVVGDPVHQHGRSGGPATLAAGCLNGAGGARRDAVDGDAVAVRWLAVAGVGADNTDRGMGRLLVSSRPSRC
jgi:copper chaperone CopZ